MNTKNFELAAALVSKTYVEMAASSRRARENAVTVLLSQRRLPDDAWDDDAIELLLRELAMMDSNQFVRTCGVGEREGRVYSAIVRRRYFGLSHGIGRSGDVAAEQPKACGSSLLQRLTNYLALDAIRLMGVAKAAACLVLPLATGMTITLCLMALRQTRPQAQYVLWPRLDQKTCIKAICSAGLTPVVIDLVRADDALQMDMDAVVRAIESVGGAEHVCAIVTSTSCFAPRLPDRVVDVARLCATRSIPHLINNAYGLQSSALTHLISEAIRVGRVDGFVQSTDKNFLVPVGGAIIAGPDKTLVSAVSKIYPGRASMGPLLDLFVTLLAMGKEGLKRALDERKANFAYLQEKLAALAARFGERVLQTKGNPISLALSLTRVPSSQLSQLGSQLFLRNVSGSRVVTGTSSSEICGVTFASYGAHFAGYPTPYLNAAATLGQDRVEIDEFCSRLATVLLEAGIKEVAPASASAPAAPAAPSAASAAASH